MKTATALYLLAFGHAMALPGVHNKIRDSTTVSRRGSTEIMTARQFSYTINCNQVIEQTIGLINRYPDYAAKALGAGAGSGLAYNVCRTLNQDRCINWAGSVGSGMTLVMWWSKMVENPAKTGEQTVTNTKRGDPALLVGRHQEWLRSELENHLVGRGTQFDSVVSMPVALGARDQGSEPSHTLEIRGLRSAPDEPATDHHLVLRGGGHGHVSITPSAARAATVVDRSLGKRVPAPGFKIAWETVDAGFGVPDKAGYDFLCDAASRDWGNRADGADKIADYIGAFEVGEAGSVQFRIIPETRDFSENTEQVETCNA
ncbi:hypothetical protein SLS62_008265 [Diatrype stigma]|uniref:Uncharacterized protein n=1 Tax=Diatrype stigma TaxID=117547 RepID=A0AAN9ULJ7_9PEZI